MLLRRQVYTLLIVVSAAMLVSRISAVTQVFEAYIYHDQDLGRDDPQTGLRQWPKARPRPVPTFGSNDRSRWATIRALVDHGTYVVGYREDENPEDKAVPFQDRGIIYEDGWKSVDKVLHPEPVEIDGKKTYRFYSSKPPLLPTLLAGEYWLLKQVFGLSLENPDDVWIIMRVILLTANALPLVIFLILLARLLERYGATDWGRLYVLAAAGFGTFLTLFAITLNNHTVGACFAFFALYVTLRIWREEKSGPLWYILAGLFAAFTAATELPAASLLGLLFLILLWRDWRPTVYYFVPAALVIVAAAMTTNYLALGRVTPAYTEVDLEGPDTGYWYKYKGSIWRKDAPDEMVPKRGPDFAHRQGETQAEYVMHCLIGHHGVFSLTPIWLLSVAGMVYGVSRFGRLPPVVRTPAPAPSAPPELSPPLEPSPPAEESVPTVAPEVPPGEPGVEEAFNFSGFAAAAPAEPVPTEMPPVTPTAAEPPSEVTPPGDSRQRWAVANEQALVAAVTLVLTVVVVSFYLWKTQNYSGLSNGLRWLFWLIPFWLLTLLPVVDGLSKSRGGRIFAYVLLALSVFSATYRDWNPWRNPWIWQFMQDHGWLPY